MKIIEHTFRVPQLEIIDGKLVLGEEIEETYTFTLLLRGVGIYEELTNRSLLSDLARIGDIKDEKEQLYSLINSRMLKAIACASYVKIEGTNMHNNRATAEEFKKKKVSDLLDRDMDFVMELYKMAVECVVGNIEQEENKKEVVKKRKK